MKKTGWIRKIIFGHWYFLGKRSGYKIKRSYINNRVTIDFLNSGSCTLFDYNGKRIAG
jgi:hypothetical protein